MPRTKQVLAVNEDDRFIALTQRLLQTRKAMRTTQAKLEQLGTQMASDRDELTAFFGDLSGEVQPQLEVAEERVSGQKYSDKEILQAVSVHGRVRDIKKVISLSEPTLYNRLRDLKKAGLIKNFGYGKYAVTAKAKTV